VWNLETGKQQYLIGGEKPTTRFHSAAFSPDGRFIAVSSSAPGRIEVREAATGTKAFTIQNEVATNLTFNADSTILAARLRGDLLGAWTIPANDHPGWYHLTEKEDRDISGISISPTHPHIAMGNYDRTIHIWHYQEQRVRKFKGHTGSIMNLCYSPDGKRIASVSGDTTARVWDAQTGEQILLLSDILGKSRGVSFSPDGKRLATGSDDQTVRIWDTNTGKEVLALTTPGNPSVVTFSPDGQRLAAVVADRVIVWDAPVDSGLPTKAPKK
jgi:WD40 repeat protein